MDKIKIGWSEVDITPEKGVKISLAGQFFERITDQVESPVKVVAMAIESGNEQLVMASCDLVSIPCNLNQAVKEYLSDKLEISVDKVMDEKISLVKYDCLGVASLIAINEAMQEDGIDPWSIDINNPEFEYDEEIFNVICSGKTDSLFAMEEKLKKVSFRH